jgi:hypothetical protein
MNEFLLYIAKLAIAGCARLLIVCGIFLSLHASLVNAEVTSLPQKDANLYMQQEVLVSTLGLLGQLVGDDPKGHISWSAAITDAGWSLTVGACPTTGCAQPCIDPATCNTNYRDGHLQMSYRGSLDKASDVIIWTGGGSFTNASGSVAWTQHGSYTHATVATSDGFFSSAYHYVVRKAGGAIRALVDISIGGAQLAAVIATPPPITLAAGVELIAASSAAVAGVTASAHDNGQEIVVEKIPMKRGLPVTILSTVQQAPAFPPFVEGFPIFAPGLLLTPNPGYPGVVVISRGKVNGDYRNEVVSVDGTTNSSSCVDPASCQK